MDDGFKFTWLPKFTATIERIPEDHRYEFMWAVVLFGTRGTEPSLEWPYDAIFESIRDDITYSHKARKSGASGGRGNKKGSEKANANDASKQDETGVKGPFKAPFADALSEAEAKQASIEKEILKKKEKPVRRQAGSVVGFEKPAPYSKPTDIDAMFDRDRSEIERYRRLREEGVAHG